MSCWRVLFSTAFSDLVVAFRGRQAQSNPRVWVVSSRPLVASARDRSLDTLMCRQTSWQAQRFGLGGRVWCGLISWLVQCGVNFRHVGRFLNLGEVSHETSRNAQR